MFKYLLYNLFVVNIFAQNYILTKINNNINDNFNFEILAKIGKTTFYRSSYEKLYNNIHTVSNNYYIEEDSIFTISQDIVQVVLNKQKTPWHLDRITKRKDPLNGKFPYTSCNTETITYIIDTGIDINHSNFNGNVKWGANFVNNVDKDENGHGTHVCGLIISKDYGVCKDANVVAVKVLDGDGSGSLSGVIKGIEYVFNEYNKHKVKSIINMSLGGGYSKLLNEAVESCLQQTDYIYFVVASGNENSDSCKTSPASANGVISVMASDINDNRAWFSNFGKCADIYAPGVNIMSTIPNDEYDSFSGTSMASPIISGVINHYLNKYKTYTSKELKKKILEDSTKNVITGYKRDTNNFLVYLNISSF